MQPVASTEAPAAEEVKGGSEALPALHVTNAEFMKAVFKTCPDGAVAVVCSKGGDPQSGGWRAEPAANVDLQCPSDRNNYFNCSSFLTDEQAQVVAQKIRFAGYHAFVADDVGTKVDADRLNSLVPTWRLETSPDNYQVGFALKEPLRNATDVEALQKAAVSANLCDPGAIGVARWARLPEAVNGKPKHCTDGRPFRCRMRTWNPEVSYSVGELLGLLGLTMAPLSPPLPATRREPRAPTIFLGSDVYLPPAAENPVLTRLRDKGLYKRDKGNGAHDITCPWVSEHTDHLDDGTAYFEPTSQFPIGGFRCHHSHGDDHHIGQLIKFLELRAGDARNRPRIRLVPGEINRIVEAAEGSLATLGRHYDSEGAIVSIQTDRDSGDLRIEQVSEQALTRELAEAADWEKYEPSNGWVRCDPTARTVTMLHRAQVYPRLPKLRGLARQPYFRDSGELVMTPGYDPISGKYASFDESKYALGELTREGAAAALARLLTLVDEFPFATEADRSAALSAMLTAAVRPALPVAPAFNLTASRPGSGKTYLGSIIARFAGPGEPHNVSYPRTSEEATKEVLSLLLHAPAAINFDDMDTDWKAHGSINRMLTSATITDRILGSNKTATVSTRTLVIGSGNNVEPLKDLRRRVISIRLFPRTATPALARFRGRPAEAVAKDRERFVSDALTIIQAWRSSGCPWTDVFDIASFGTWSDYCRQPLLWLGQQDPAMSLQEQIQSDPENEELSELLRAWTARFGERSVTVRQLIGDVDQLPDMALHEALMDLPVVEAGKINRGKLGYYLKKRLGRVVDGLMIENGDSTERKSWRVVRVADQLSP